MVQWARLGLSETSVKQRSSPRLCQTHQELVEPCGTLDIYDICMTFVWHLPVESTSNLRPLLSHRESIGQLLLARTPKAVQEMFKWLCGHRSSKIVRACSCKNSDIMTRCLSNAHFGYWDVTICLLDVAKLETAILLAGKTTWCCDGHIVSFWYLPTKCYQRRQPWRHLQYQTTKTLIGPDLTVENSPAVHPSFLAFITPMDSNSLQALEKMFDPPRRWSKNPLHPPLFAIVPESPQGLELNLKAGVNSTSAYFIYTYLQHIYN